MSTSGNPDFALSSAPGRWIVATSVAGSAMVFLDSTVVNVALPTIGRELHAATSSLQWILNGYVLTLAAFILLGGSLGDRFGRRRVFVWGIAVFTLASLLCALAPNVQLLIVARLLQGLGGALLTPGSLAMIEASFREKDRARAIGAWSGLGGVATALGPLLGGYLVQAVSWRAIFVINLPLGLIVAVMANRHVPETRDPTASGGIDVRGAVLAAAALGGISYALINGPASGLTTSVLVSAVGGVCAFAGFLVSELHSKDPMLPLGLFRSSQFTGANVVTFVVYAALSGVFFLLVSFLQVSLHYSPLAAGAASLPVTLLMLALSERSGALAQRIGPRIPLTIGPLVVAVGLLLMTRISPGDSYVATVLPAIAVFGLGLTLVVAPVTATALASAGAEHSGIASGVNNAVSRVAGLLAVAVLPVLVGLTGDKYYQPSAMTSGFHTAMFICAGLAAFGGVLAWFVIRNDVLRPARREAIRPSEAAPTPAALASTNTDPRELCPPEFSCGIAGTPMRSAVRRSGAST